MQTINIAKDFTQFPGGRYRAHGKGSGEQFREDVLLPVIAKKEQMTIDLDGTSGYPSSFLEEAFGGLVRKGFSPAQVREAFIITSSPEYASYVQLIWTYVDRADAQTKASA